MTDRVRDVSNRFPTSASLTAELSAKYSASVDERATVVWSFEFHEMAALPRVNR
jgi:hypothetical protein